MGWSCSAKAGDVMNAWTKACVAQTESSNVFRTGGAEYFWEVSNKEHADGAITGTIQKVVRREGDTSWCRQVGTFRINGDGTVARAPAWLRAVKVDFRPPMSIGSGGAS